MKFFNGSSTDDSYLDTTMDARAADHGTRGGGGGGRGGGGGHDGGGGGHSGGGGGGKGGEHGNGGGHGGGGGGPDKGVLYGDQITILRDLDPSDGGGDGEAVYDDYNDTPQLIAVGYDPDGLVRPGDSDGLFPIYFEMVGEDDYEIPATLLPFVQEVELERANVARAPEHVMEKSLLAAVEKLMGADIVQTDPAGRVMYSNDDGDTFLTIDSPLENLALYQALLTAGNSGSWTGVQEDWDAIRVDNQFVDLSFLKTLDGFDPSSLMGAAWSKEGKITLDALLYENTTLGVNEAKVVAGDAVIDYFDFNDGSTETYDYTRSERYGDTWLRWIEIDPGTGQPVFAYGTVYDAVFEGAEWGAAQDTYMAVETFGDSDPGNDDFIFVDASGAGVNDFAQAADDSRAVIAFVHDFMAEEVDITEVPDAFLLV